MIRMGILITFLLLFVSACGTNSDVQKLKFLDDPNLNKLRDPIAGEAFFAYQENVQDSGEIQILLQIQIPDFLLNSGNSVGNTLGSEIFVQLQNQILSIPYDEVTKQYSAVFDITSLGSSIFNSTIAIKDSNSSSSRTLHSKEIATPSPLLSDSEALSFSQRTVSCTQPVVRWSNPSFNMKLSMNLQRLSQSSDSNLMKIFSATPIFDDGEWTSSNSGDDFRILDLFDRLFSEEEKNQTSFIVADTSLIREQEAVDLNLTKLNEEIPLNLVQTVVVNQPMTFIWRTSCQ